MIMLAATDDTTRDSLALLGAAAGDLGGAAAILDGADLKHLAMMLAGAAVCILEQHDADPAAWIAEC